MATLGKMRAARGRENGTTTRIRDDNSENSQTQAYLGKNQNRKALGDITQGTNIINADVGKGASLKPVKPLQAQPARSKSLMRKNSLVEPNSVPVIPQDQDSKNPIVVQHLQGMDTDSTPPIENDASLLIGPPTKPKPSRVPDDIDARDEHEPLAVVEYVDDMYTYFKNREARSVNSSYMNSQPHINVRMRAILIDWLVEVHLKFKLVPDTLFLTIALIDKYLELKPVTRQNLQLVGVACFLIAAKYEEIYPPEIRDLVYITDRAYTKEQILEMESSILNALHFQISFPTVYCFLLRYLKAAHADKRIVQLSCYVAERLLQEYSIISHRPSVIAACAVYIARKNLNRSPWSPTLIHYTKYNEEDLRPCLQDIATVFVTKNDLVAVYRKFSSHKFGAVAAMNIDVFGVVVTPTV